MFHVGQLCACVVDRSFWKPWDGETLPAKGRIYTVREVNPLSRWGEHPHVRLVEITNAPQRYGDGVFEVAFDAAGFRPLDDSRLDVFRKALTDAPVDLEPVE